MVGDIVERLNRKTNNREMNPRFSIIVPLYNKAPYVRKALNSIISQTFTDWECIVINDGSSDNSLEVVKNFVDEYKIYDLRFKIVDQPNSGVAAARNSGVKESRGEYVCFLDADDWWEANYLEEIDELILEYPDAGIYCSNYIYYKPGKTHIALNLERGYMNYPEAYLNSTSMPICTCATCMPRKVFEEMGGFPNGIQLGEDFLLWAKTVLHYKVAFCEKPLAYYNNDVPASMRATRNLHAPLYHKLFNLYEIEQLALNSKQPEVWKALLDKHRVVELYDYWLSNEYHDAANDELQKVDWSKQPKSVKALYSKPIWLLKVERRVKQVGSYCKQRLIKMIKL